jgi:hypothetical protein
MNVGGIDERRFEVKRPITMHLLKAAGSWLPGVWTAVSGNASLEVARGRGKTTCVRNGFFLTRP